MNYPRGLQASYPSRIVRGMMLFRLSVLVGLVPVTFGTMRHVAAEPPVASGMLPHFTKRQLTDRYYSDGVAWGDFNRDGQRDLVAGPFWWAGPDFSKRHAYYPPQPFEPARSPTDCMLLFVHDFNDDGWDDILVLGRVHLHAAYWYENPGNSSKAWARHYVFERVRGESPQLADLNGDGRPELICHWNHRWGWLEPDARASHRAWTFRPIGEPGEWNEFYHGMGVGDIDGDGRADLILNDGWYRQPAEQQSLWEFHRQRFSSGRGGAQMYAYDVDGDGDNDVISSLDAHGWGLAWFEQVQSDQQIGFIPHPIMGTRKEEARYGVAFSQPHALTLADLDGDALLDIVVGKRRWAHGPQGDVEPNAEPVIYWFQLQRTENRVRYVPHQIDNASGVGVQISAADMNGDRRVDVLSCSKLGTFLFLNQPGL